MGDGDDVTPEVKICTNCKHSRWNIAVLLAGNHLRECHRPSLPIDLTNGKIDYSYCDIQRKRDYQCGKEGKYYEGKE